MGAKREAAARLPKDLLPSEFRSRQRGLRSALVYFDEDCSSEASASFGQRRGSGFSTRLRFVAQFESLPLVTNLWAAVLRPNGIGARCLSRPA